jgi:hypothetical protein
VYDRAIGKGNFERGSTRIITDERGSSDGTKNDVMPAKAGIHFGFPMLKAEQHGFPLSRE